MVFCAGRDILTADLLSIELHLEASLAENSVWHVEAGDRVTLDEWIILATEIERPQEAFIVQMEHPHRAV